MCVYYLHIVYWYELTVIFVLCVCVLFVLVFY